MDVHELARAERAYRVAAGRADELRDRRNALVLQALEEGWTHARIASVTGLSRGRIGQIRPSATGPGRTKAPRARPKPSPRGHGNA